MKKLMHTHTHIQLTVYVQFFIVVVLTFIEIYLEFDFVTDEPSKYFIFECYISWSKVLTPGLLIVLHCSAL